MPNTSKSESSVLPTVGGKALLDPSDTVILLLDHQAGLFQTVKDIAIADLRRNVEVIAKLATLLKIPVITTASEPSGSNGPLMPEIHRDAPHAVYVARKGEVNAWGNEAFVEQVHSTGRKTLVMAGVWTNVCMMFPALDARAAGFDVYTVIDASGDPSDLASRRMRFCPSFIAPGLALKQRNSRSCMVWRHPTTLRSRKATGRPLKSRSRRNDGDLTWGAAAAFLCLRRCELDHRRVIGRAWRQWGCSRWDVAVLNHHNTTHRSGSGCRPSSEAA
jgi:nicotinamidase-related amidase